MTAGNTTIVNFALQPNPGTINGTVTDACMGNPLPGTIILVENGSTVVGFDVTDSNGNYSIDTLAPGNYTVTATLHNFVVGSAPATVTSGTLTTVNFSLIPEALPPASISGSSVKDKFLTQTVRNQGISWTASPGECVTGYQIFRNGVLIAFVPPNVLTYQDPNRNNNTDVYSVRTVNSFGLVSDPISVTIK